MGGSEFRSSLVRDDIWIVEGLELGGYRFRV